MRPIDAAIKDLEMIEDCRTCGNKNPFCDSNPDGCSGYKWRGVPFAATDDSRPLTLEQLREMDGEPVWVVQIDRKLRPFWMLVDADDESVASRLYCALFEDYGTEWLAYRRKPEEGET